MADSAILSQREIDNLLKAGPGEEEERAAAAPASSVAGLAKTVKRYDFRRPDKFSKEQLRTLQAIHETFARLSGTTLSNQLRTNVEVKLSSIDQGLYEEYINQVVTPAFVHVVRMAPLEGSILLEFGQDIGFVMVDRLLGGGGALLDRTHEVTDIDLQLLRNIGGMLAEDMGEAWENLAAIQPTISELQQEIHAASLAPPTEVVIMVFMEVSVLDVVAGLSICTPFSVLEPLLPLLAAQAWAGTRSRHASEKSREHLRTQIERTPARLGVELGSVQVRAADLARLQTGDVIRLEGRASRAIPVRVGRIRKWWGRPGVIGGRLAVELERWAPEEMPAATSAADPVMGAGDEDGPTLEPPTELAAPAEPAPAEIELEGSEETRAA